MMALTNNLFKFPLFLNIWPKFISIYNKHPLSEHCNQ